MERVWSAGIQTLRKWVCGEGVPIHTEGGVGGGGDALIFLLLK